MKIRIAVLLLALLLPIKADALFIFDIGATPSSIANTATDAGRAATDVKKAKTFWKTLKSIGDGIRSIADFYSKAKTWIKVRYDKYQMYRASVKNFIEQTERFYNSVMDAYAAVLDAAEFAAEVGQRIKAYIQEGKDIVKYAKESYQSCKETAKYMVDFKQQWDDQSEIYRENKNNKDARIAQLEQEIKDLQEAQSHIGERSEEAIQKDIEFVTTQLHQVKSQISALERQRASIVGNRQRNTEYELSEEEQERVNEIDQQLNVLQAQDSNLSGQIEDLTRELENERNAPNTTVQNIRNLRDQLAVARAEAETYKEYLQNIENQIFNYNRQIVNMVNDCRYRIQMTVARTKRLICNMTTGTMSQYANKFDNITGQINNMSSSLSGMDSEIEHQSNMMKKTSAGTCAQLKSECHNGFGGVTAEAIAEGEVKRQASCQSYQQNCAQTTTQEIMVIPSLAGGVPQCESIVQNIKTSVIKYVDCGLVKGQCLAEATTKEDKDKKDNACRIHCQHCGYIEGACLSSDFGSYGGDDGSHVINQCDYLKIQCDILKSSRPDYENMMDCKNWKENCSQPDNSANGSGPSAQQFSAVYSIHNSMTIAQASAEAQDMSSISMTPTDTPEGEFIQPSSIATICELDNLDKINGLPECLSKFNDVKFAKTETDIPENMIEFYKAIRNVKTAPGKEDKNFNPKHQSEDAKIANRYMNDIYAEYLASAYFRGMNFYKKYFMYDLDVINPMQTSVGSDVGATWASVSLVEQELSSLIYDIYTMWSKEQLVSAVEGMVNHQISQESMQNAAKNDLQSTENSNE